MKILIACGASGGHIFPGLALGISLNERLKNAEVLFVCSNRYLDKRIFTRERLKFKCLSSNKLPFKASPKFLTFTIRLLFDVVRSIFIILNFAPDVIVGFGGYVSFPIVVIGRILGLPIVIHEQNVTAGRANSLLFKFARRIAVSFEETLDSMPSDVRDKAVLTGNPIRTGFLKEDKEVALKEFSFDRDRFTVLVIGGSQGAKRLNRIFAESVTTLDEETRKSIQVVHITGDRDREWIEAIYDNFNVPSRVFSFIDRIDKAYSIADLVFTRSGAAALFELAFYAKPMVLIPYPHALNHQRENALVFSKKGAAIYKEEETITPKELRLLITEFMNNRSTLETMSSASRSLSKPDAADELAKVVISVGMI